MNRLRLCRVLEVVDVRRRWFWRVWWVCWSAVDSGRCCALRGRAWGQQLRPALAKSAPTPKKEATKTWQGPDRGWPVRPEGLVILVRHHYLLLLLRCCCCGWLQLTTSDSIGSNEDCRHFHRRRDVGNRRIASRNAWRPLAVGKRKFPLSIRDDEFLIRKRL